MSRDTSTAFHLALMSHAATHRAAAGGVANPAARAPAIRKGVAARGGVAAASRARGVADASSNDAGAVAVSGFASTRTIATCALSIALRGESASAASSSSRRAAARGGALVVASSAAAAAPGGADESDDESSVDATGQAKNVFEAVWKFVRPHTIRGTILGTTAIVTRVLLHHPELFTLALVPKALLGLLALLCGNGYIVGINQARAPRTFRFSNPTRPSPRRRRLIASPFN